MRPIEPENLKAMKTYLTITYSLTTWSNTERSVSFIRPRNRPTPTDLGAARMVAQWFNDSGQLGDGDPVKPSEVSIHRIEEAVYAS